MARLVLVGLPGAGKTTLARGLAEEWRCAYVDTDELLASEVGTTAAQYLREHGETSFRARELDALRGALAVDGVVSTGAGVVTTPAARTLLEGERTWWLDADDETLLERVRDGERPLLGDDHRAALVELRQRRARWYEEVARVRLDGAGSLEDVLRRAIEQVQSESS